MLGVLAINGMLTQHDCWGEPCRKPAAATFPELLTHLRCRRRPLV